MHSMLTVLWADSGQQLRQDDPVALKDIIAIVQTKLSNQDELLKYVYHPLHLALNLTRMFMRQLTYSLYDRDPDQSKKQQSQADCRATTPRRRSRPADEDVPLGNGQEATRYVRFSSFHHRLFSPAIAHM